MTFEEVPLINSAALIRRAGATPYTGRQVQERLVQEGRISPVVTGTKRPRTLLTPRDGKALFEALTAA